MERSDGIARRDPDAEVSAMLDELRQLRQWRCRRAKCADFAGRKSEAGRHPGKVAIDIPSPYDGTITEVRVQEYDPIGEGEVIALIEVD